MTDNVTYVVKDCEHECKEPAELQAWDVGFKFLLNNMYVEDKNVYIGLLDSLGLYKLPRCWKCYNDFFKDVGNQAKVAGPRWSHLYLFFLDMYALGRWVTFTPQEVAKEALVFTKQREDTMFPEETDDEVYDNVIAFLNSHCHIDPEPENTLERWLVSRAWANHGTATDVPKTEIDFQKDIVQDKAGLAFEMDDKLLLDFTAPFENKVFPKRDRKKRIIVVGGTPEYIIGSFVNNFVSNNLTTQNFQVSNTKKSVDPNDIIRSNLSSGLINFPIDQSAFDQHQRKSAVLAARNWMIDKVYERVKDDRLLLIKDTRQEFIVHELFESKLPWESGLLSGKWYTSLCGSLLNAYEIFRCNNKTWSGIVLPTLHQGDDAQLCVYNESTIEKLLKNAELYNIAINPNKNFADRYRTDYLHRMHSTGPLNVSYGDTPMTAQYQSMAYPCRVVTSMVHGDQELPKQGTTVATQSTLVAKKVDRWWALVTRTNHLDSKKAWDILNLNEIERDFVRTPSALGGLGMTYLGRPKRWARRKSPDRVRNYHLVEGFGGYDRAIRETEKMYGVKFEYNDIMKQIQGTLKFKTLAPKVSSQVRSTFYDIEVSKVQVRETLLCGKDKFTRRIDFDPQSSWPTQPSISGFPAWRGAASLLVGDRRYWDVASHQMARNLARTGRYVVKLWETGGTSISVQYTRRLNAEQSSRLARSATQTFLTFLVGHRGSDLKENVVRTRMLELECAVKRSSDEQILSYYSW